MTATPGAPQRSPSPSIPWLVAGALLVGLGLVGVLVFVRDDSHAPLTGNTNQVTANVPFANANTVLNTNAAANTNSSPTPSDWLTYRDAASQHTVQYPPTWETVATSYATVGFRPLNTQTGDPEWAAIYLSFRPNPNALALEAFYAQAEDFADLYEASTSHEQRTVGAHQATYFAVIPGAVANAAVAFPLGEHVSELQMHRDQIGRIEALEDTFFSIAASAR